MRSWDFNRIARIGEAIVVSPPHPTRLALSATGVPTVLAPSPPARIVATSVYPAAPVTDAACRSSSFRYLSAKINVDYLPALWTFDEDRF